MADSPWSAVTSLSLRYSITIDNKKIPDIYDITSLSITHGVNTISKADISLTGNYLSDFNKLPVLDDGNSSLLTPGKEVIIKVGYSENSLTEIFSGIIMTYSVDIGEDKPINISIGCKHQAVNLTNKKVNEGFCDKTDSDIITALFSDNSLTPTIDTTTIKNEQLPKGNATQWDLAVSKAEVNGFLIFLDNDPVVVSKPKTDSEPVLRITTGKDLFDFKAEVSSEKQYSSVIAYGSDGTQEISATASEPKLNLHGSVSLNDNLNKLTYKISLDAICTKEELKELADNHLLRMRLSSIRGSLSFVGSATVKTGSLIELDNVGAKYDGKAFISSVTHFISSSLWKTSVTFGVEYSSISKQPDFARLPISDFLPPVQGLRIEQVTKLTDPKGKYRIQIQPKGGTGSIPIWAQYANQYATNNAGFAFMPEVGDDVLVGNIGDDPRQPIILGCLHNKDHNTHPNPAKDENNYIKSITTKSLLTLSFDDEKKIIIIKTPAGNTITISDDDKSIEILDQTKNSIKLSTDGIVLTSKKDIKLIATGDISIAATGKLTLDSKQDMTATSSMNISHKAQLGFTAKGTATAEVSATGNTTVKGGMVMIN